MSKTINFELAEGLIPFLNEERERLGLKPKDYFQFLLIKEKERSLIKKG